MGLTRDGLAVRIESGPWRAGVTRRWDGGWEAGLEATLRF